MRGGTAVTMLLALPGCTGAPADAVPGPPPEKRLPLPGERFWIGAHAAFAIPAAAPACGQRWLLYAPTLPPYPDRHERWLFEQLTAAGVAIAGVDVGESYGSPTGVALFAALCDHLAARGWSRTPVLLARSRGGLQQLAFASAHPDRVAAIAGIYPVCDLASYPGLARAAPAFGRTEQELAARLARHNPIDRLAAIAAAHISIFVIHGDQDRTVPLEANSGALAERYRALGGPVELEVAAGRGHDGWTGFFRSTRLRDFVVQHAR